MVGHNNALGSGSVTFADGTKLRAVTDPTKVIGNNITLNGRTTVEVPFAGATNIELAGVISGSGSLGVASDVSGRGLTLSGSNTFTGGVEIFSASDSRPVVQIANSSALGTGTLTITANTGVPASGSEQLAAGANGLTIANPVAFVNGSTLGIDTSGYSLTMSGVLSGTGGALRKSGNGTLTLTGDNSYSGGTTVSAGTLLVNSASALGLGTLTNNAQVNIASTAGPVFNLSGLAGNSATATLNLLSETTDLAINQSVDTTYAGSITGPITLNKVGSGTLTLSGVNTYSGGTKISSGTLFITDCP